MKNCGTCKHWNNTDNANGWPSHTLSMHGFSPDYGECLRIIHGAATPLKALAFVIDCEDYSATLFTLANFGCILHEDK